MGLGLAAVVVCDILALLSRWDQMVSRFFFMILRTVAARTRMNVDVRRRRLVRCSDANSDGSAEVIRVLTCSDLCHGEIVLSEVEI